MNIEVSVDYLPVINFSMQQNHVPVIRGITVKNISGEELTNLSIAIEFDPGFAEPASLYIDRIAPYADDVLTPVNIQLSTSYLSALTERVSGSIKVSVSA